MGGEGEGSTGEKEGWKVVLMMGGIWEEYMGILTYFWVIERVHVAIYRKTCSVLGRNET